jgi:hypothetical protein
MRLNNSDLEFVKRKIPKKLVALMEGPEWYDKIFIAGGLIRSSITGEPVSDIDVFITTDVKPIDIALLLEPNTEKHFVTDNAITITSFKPSLQIINRWSFKNPGEVVKSFDFTIACAAIFVKDSGDWDSIIDDSFYEDLAARRLVYRYPIRNEDAGGSILRVLKFYQRGYRIPLDSLAGVIARLIKDFDVKKIPLSDEKSVAHVLTGLLIEVDPNAIIDESITMEDHNVQ